MKLLYYSKQAPVPSEIASEAQGLGFDIERWTPEDVVPPNVHVVIIDGLEAVIEAGRIPAHCLALVEEAEIVHFAEVPFPIAEYLVKPLRSAEVKARLSLLSRRPSIADETRRNILGEAVTSSADIFEVTTPGAEYEYVNPAFEAVLGHSLEEIKGKTVASVLRGGHHPDSFYKNIGETLDAGKVWKGTITSVNAEGRTVHLESTIAPIFDDKGDMTHHVAVKRDITERLRREQTLAETNRALEQARDAAVSASRAKSEFLANMSHELRTPLNAIIGYSEMLIEDYEDNEQTVKDLNRIRSAGTHLLNLINDVLDLSKIEAERIELNIETFPLSELIDSVTETIRPLVGKGNNTFALQVEDGLGEMRADRTRVQQILLNLLSNACKFTRDGEVSLSVVSEESEMGRVIRFRVQDSGIGISPEQLERLFQPFVQADASTTRKFGGTGLGLVISKRFAEMMRGQITIESELDKGSTFTLELPLRARARNSRMPPFRRSSQPLVLLIDDDLPVHDLFARYLEKRGFQVQCAASGPEGVAKAVELLPDAIVLDVRMPGMSGWEVLSTLKLNERTAHIPVIMMTIMEQDDVGKALGASDYLVKPIEPSRLLDTLRRFVDFSGAQVLVVEDEEATRELICRTLQGAGHSTIEAENGKVALEALRNENPDFIILDLMMPVMDGFTFLDEYSRDESLKRVPIVIATARSLSELEQTELLAVSERIIEKGAFSREQLLDSICQQVNRLIGDDGKNSKA